MNETSSRSQSGAGAARAVVFGGLVVGVLDGLDAVIFFGARGVTAARIFQHIASAVLGKAAFSGGAATVALGVALHFAVAFCIVAAFVVLAAMVPWFRAHWVAGGMVFGLLAYGGMNYAVLPLTRVAAAGGVPPWPVLLNGLLAHVFLVGLPAAWVLRRQARAG